MNNLISIALEGNYIESNFNRIKNGNQLNTRNKPFNTKMLNDMIEFYEQSEDYEKCKVLLNYKHKLLNHENNYKI